MLFFVQISFLSFSGKIFIVPSMNINDSFLQSTKDIEDESSSDQQSQACNIGFCSSLSKILQILSVNTLAAEAATAEVVATESL